MWRNVGIERSGDRLAETIEIAQIWAKYVLDKVFDTCSGWEIQNMLTVSLLIAIAAHFREESRGVHFRSDFPERNDQNWQLHVQVRRKEGHSSPLQISTLQAVSMPK